MDNDVNRYDNLVRYVELIWNGHLHTEKLSHEMFYVLTILMIGSWTISSQLKSDNQILTSILLNIFAMILAVAGLFMIYNLQKSVQNIHVKMNLIRKKLDLDNLKVDVNLNGVKADKIIFEGWMKYELEEIRDLGWLPTRKGLKGEKSRYKWWPNYSWWAIYKWLYVVMFIISMIFCLSSIPS